MALYEFIINKKRKTRFDKFILQQNEVIVENIGTCL